MEDLNEGNVGADDSRVEDSSQEESGQQSSPMVSMEVEEEGSRERPSTESDSLSKRELVKIIADQDKAIAMLRRELEGGRSVDAREYSPPVRKQDKLVYDSEAGEYWRPHYEGPNGDHPSVRARGGRLVILPPQDQRSTILGCLDARPGALGSGNPWCRAS
ncbi:unnamed protein product [Linum trigynum]|uniref:Uncharacterized protein n=1 Tax=Linum trigynum TaxID=586398 RepID=A0AAV2DTB1_9ROSI